MTLPDLQALAAGLAHARQAIRDSNRDWTTTDLDARLYAIFASGDVPGEVAKLADQHRWSDHTLDVVLRASMAIRSLLGAAGQDTPQPASRKPAFFIPSDRSPIPFTVDGFRGTVGYGLNVGYNASGQPLILPPGNIIVAAPRGSGGSNFLHNVIAAIAQTVDAVAWVCDETWDILPSWLVRPNADGGYRIDWPAVTLDEVTMVVDAGLALAGRRRAKMLDDHGPTGRHQPTSTDPAVFIVVDDASIDYTEGEHRERCSAVRRNLRELMRTGPSMSVFVVQRVHQANPDTIRTSARKAATSIVATGGLDSGAYTHILGTRDVDGMATLQLGEVAVRRSAGSPTVYARIPRMDPTVIRELVESLDAAPSVTVATLNALPQYETRWEGDHLNRVLKQIRF